MKGVIATCLRDMVMTKFGKDKWEEALAAAGFEKNASFLVTQDIEDATVLKLLEAARRVLGLTTDQAAEAFGEYWVCTYAAKIYKPYFQAAASAKEFLLNMDEVHRITTENIPNARPPRFEYTWQDSKTLLMKYKSQRNLIDLLAALVKGVGKHFKENLRVTKQSGDTLKIVFA
jgi:Haem-NO-binding